MLGTIFGRDGQEEYNPPTTKQLVKRGLSLVWLGIVIILGAVLRRFC